MDRKQAKAFALAWIIGEDDNLLGWDAPWRADYPEDTQRLEDALDYYFGLLRRKLQRLDAAIAQAKGEA